MEEMLIQNMTKIVVHIADNAKKLYSKHKGMTALCMISFGLVGLYIITLDTPEWFSGAGKIFEVTFQISIGYIINYIFFVVNVYIPKVATEDKALISTKYVIARLLSEIHRVEDIFDSFIELQYARIHFTPGIIYYKKKDTKFFDYIDLNEFLKIEQFILRKKIEEITSIRYFFDLDSKIIELINDIQYCEFICYLERFSKYAGDLNEPVFGTNKYIIFLNDSYYEFKDLAEKLSKRAVLEIPEKNIYTLLSDEELEEYKKFIQDARNNHQGKFDSNIIYYTENKRYN